MDRRRFTFWLGFGLFSLSEKLHVAGFDALAAATMRGGNTAKKVAKRTGAEHWTVAGNKEWRWFERENLVKGDWVVTGRTTPINKLTGKRRPENIAYIDDSLVPSDLRANDAKKLDLVDHEAIAAKDAADDKVKPADHQVAVADADVNTGADHTHDEPKVDLDSQLPTEKCRARHGRPPSKWLRSLNAGEISVWLKTVELPDAGVSGMTVWAHLTRDHGFTADRIEGLTESEQDKLHAAAHYGY
jgi:hypothetical protein